MICAATRPELPRAAQITHLGLQTRRVDGAAILDALAGHDLHRVTGLAHARLPVQRPGLVAVVGDHAAAVVCQALDDRRSDAAGATGDQCHASAHAVLLICGMEWLPIRQPDAQV